MAEHGIPTLGDGHRGLGHRCRELGTGTAGQGRG